MNSRITVVVDEDLHFRCKKDAEEQRLSLSSYVAHVLKDRHGLMKMSVPPPVITELPMQAKKASTPGYNFFDL